MDCQRTAQLTRIHELLAARGCELSYQSLRRFVLNRNWRRVSKTTVRMEDTPPGEVAEADFGRMGMITDPVTGQRKAGMGHGDRAVPFAALLRLADAAAEVGGRHRGTGSGVGVLWRDAQIPGRRQFPRRGGGY